MNDYERGRVAGMGIAIALLTMERDLSNTLAQNSGPMQGPATLLAMSYKIAVEKLEQHPLGQLAIELTNSTGQSEK
jgi:hypothetical protein